MSIKNFCGLVLCGVLSLSSLAEAYSDDATERPKDVKPTGEPAKTGDEALTNLRAELDEASEVWLTKYRQATSDIERIELEKQNVYRAFEPKFLEFARTYSKERVAIDAVQWLAATANPGPVFDEALLLIERHHLQDKGVVKMCRTLVDRRTPGIERFMLAVATNNSNHNVQGEAYLSLARYLNQTHAMATHLRGADERLRAQLKREYSEDIAAWMLTADPKKLSARIDGICKNIISDYGDVNDDEYADATGKRRTLADAAKALLFSLHAVGSVAPEIAGVGVDGTRVSLSDQRGKVVVLMFSADWCGPCKMMYGQLRELMKLYADKPFSVMTVMADNELSTVSKAVDSREIVWPVIWDGSKGVIANEWNITKYPTIYLIDRDGRIVSEALRDDPLDDEVARMLGISAESRVKVDKRTRVWNVSFKDKNLRGDDVPKLLEGYTEMRNLDLSYNSISDEDLRHLLPFKKLATLHLEHTNVTDKGLQILKGLPNLKELHLSVKPSEGTTTAGQRALSNAIPGLRVLIITH